MTMEHKAFILDYNAFREEISDSLQKALLTGDLDSLIDFINMNIDSLKDSYEGQPLDYSWETMIELKDAHQYGDFALTKFYNPAHSIGLGYEWEDIQNILSSELDETSLSMILGEPFGSENNYFDPGKMGSYFQSPEQVKKNWQIIQNLVKFKFKKIDNLSILIGMFQQAVAIEQGLYITF
ncbi:MAG TPA: hypothetical protein DEG17_01740 [Cyanobacteria bacterium UBA11149]|nr:hypothetical protein [Cyanobacteria bacterium UBA11367]HBE56656.1 hypothetical protein [Cyanobacteria bacterium UBA11366]HBK66356.1 hypothetical protein [Cyanobacteria bacterium UBA11166]HBR74122.1 hypothetical protein [Cyanobacteria bacterium UBA11159]HBS71351.1 hypothetical protein [Cyanobacteria bacterium UBA11153]HBW87632.1 hypothetical protein [Cyanobacteria bacterium UBA11149]HCA95096.1 hypothetical protein [Cyanobacteria bacterium UBA9226]